MMTDSKQVLDSIFQETDPSIRVMDQKSQNEKDKDKNKPKPHELRRNIEDYLGAQSAGTEINGRL